MAKTPAKGTSKVPKAPRGIPWTKGQTGNPKGSSEKQRVLGKIAKLTNEECLDMGSLILKGDALQLAAMAEDKSIPVLRWWMAQLILKSAENGDAGTFNAVMSRLLGKPRETVDVGGQPGGAPITIKSLTTEEKLERLAQLRRAREQVAK